MSTMVPGDVKGRAEALDLSAKKVGRPFDPTGLTVMPFGQHGLVLLWTGIS